jgi:hypothetical protein
LWNIVADLSDKTLGGLSDRIAAHHSLRKLYNFAFLDSDFCLLT